MNVKISHECPLQLLKQSTKWNDYDYILVHLLDKYPEYYEFAKHQVKSGRTVILDNSIFELGTAFDMTKYAEWIVKLQPTEYIVPDALQNTDKTIFNFATWLCKYNKLPGKKIGVVQGNTYDEIVYCYRYMVEQADKIAISFDYDYYLITGLGANKWQKYADGRQKLIHQLWEDKIWNNNIPNHLLGAAIPQEFKKYNYEWGLLNIETLDTSNPVQQGLLEIKYTDNGLEEKNTLKVADSFEATYTLGQIEVANYNVVKFKEFCHGK